MVCSGSAAAIVSLGSDAALDRTVRSDPSEPCCVLVWLVSNEVVVAVSGTGVWSAVKGARAGSALAPAPVIPSESMGMPGDGIVSRQSNGARGMANRNGARPASHPLRVLRHDEELRPA